VFRVHEVGHLTGATELGRIQERLEAAAATGSDPGQVGDDLERLARRREEVEQALERLVTAATAMITPELTGGQRIERLGLDRVGLLGVAAQQAWMQDLLEGSAGFLGRIRIRARVWNPVPAGLVERWTGSNLSILEPAEERRLVETLEAAGLVPTAPVALVHPLQPCRLFVGEEVPHVADWEIQVLPGGREVPVPRLETFEGGLTLSLNAAPLADGRVALDFHLVSRTLIAMRPHETTLGDGHRLTLALPESSDLTFKGRSYLPAQQVVLLLSHDLGEQGGLVLLSAERVPD
jgi:hypothetical protein